VKGRVWVSGGLKPRPLVGIVPRTASYETVLTFLKKTEIQCINVALVSEKYADVLNELAMYSVFSPNYQ
jgi:hypothetical protein